MHPLFQNCNADGENATDSALIIDAMDLLRSAPVNEFRIASSDSEYAGLATRAREKDLLVIGIGRSSTSESYVDTDP